MRKRAVSCACLWSLCALAIAPLHAQNANQRKPPVYTYVSEWAVPRDQWPEMVKLDEQDRALLDKLVSEGTLTGYGAFTNLIHQEGEPTHGTWLIATSEGNLLKALEAIYAQPGSTNAAVQAASKHWDYFLQGQIYGHRSGKSENGYLAYSEWDVKPGQMRAYNDLIRSTLVPVYDRLVDDGVVTSYGMDEEDFHTQKIGRVSFYFTTNDTAAFDKASKAFDEAFEKNTTLIPALQSMVERDNHRDFLARVRFMSNK